LTNNIVLVIEDDPELRLLLATVLELEHKQVITAEDGREGFRLARLHRPDVIVLDLMMPTMTGEEFRQAQVANAEIRQIPVLVVSAHPQGEAIAKRMEVAGYLPKPLDFDALVNFINNRTARGASPS
jgi:DNA-binding response OmpR family regulator